MKQFLNTLIWASSIGVVLGVSTIDEDMEGY